MEPIKRVEGVSPDGQGQSLALAEVVHNQYWRKQAEITRQKVEANENSAKVSNEQEKQPPGKLSFPANAHRTYAEFEVNQDTHEVIVRIIDSESGKLVRTIPPDELAKEIVKGNFQPSQLRRRAVLV